jgi:DNA repair exonuclease SbcCD ATPase subunit
MLKKAVVGSLAVATLGTFVFGRDAWSYLRTGASSVRDAVKREVPIEFEIERARKEVEQLLPEIRKSMHVIAQEQVEVEHLKQAISKREAGLENQEEAILTLSADLKSGDTHFVYAGRNYHVKDVQRDLAERFNRYKVAEDTLRREREVLVAKEAALESHRETLESMLSQRKDLDVELERLEARLRTVEARKTISELNIDDSQLARVKTLIREIDKKLDIEDELLNAEGNFAGLIPIEKESEIPEDIAVQVDEYFSGRSTETRFASQAR